VYINDNFQNKPNALFEGQIGSAGFQNIEILEFL